MALGASIAGLIVAVLSAASGIYSGEQQRKSSSKALRSQKEGQRQSLLASVGQEKLAAQETARLNKKKPDVDTLLFSERAKANMGPGSTLLAGRGAQGTPLLGSKSLMGG